MIELQSASNHILLPLLFGLPLLAVGLGAYQRPRWLVIGYMFLLLVMVVNLTTLWILLEENRYKNATGMEGIAFAVLPIVYLGSAILSSVIYFVAAWIVRRR